MSRDFKLIAHRGLSSLAPENSITAFEKAGKASYYGIEADIHGTKDDELVIFHDYTLPRMVGIEKEIRDLTLKEIKELRLNAGNNVSKYNNEHIPTLKEYLKICKKYNVKPIAEIKRVNKMSSLDDIIIQIKKLSFKENFTVISFNKDYLIYLRKNYPNLDIQYLLNEITAEDIEFASKNNFDIDVNYHSVTKDIIDEAHKQNVLINVWTVDDLKTAKELVKMGVDFITTNKLTNKDFK